jgi:hypothetical protein
MKCRLEVIYRGKELKQVSKFMRNLDLDMGEIGIEEVFTFTCKKDASIELIKDTLKKGFELFGMEILQIKGGIIE